MKSRIKSWKRPSEMTVYSGSPSLWGSKGKPVPNGVAQMSLGDCWFLSAASAIAEQPERIKRVIWNDSYDKNGAFRYFFWVKNKWHGVNIDDRLPMSGSYPYATQRSKDGAWWMPLMEKAYAKLDQNYERIIAGMGYEGLRTLTGMPTYYINNKRGGAKDESWKLLKALADKNFPMTTPCCNNIGETYRLVSGHAYTLLNVLQLSNGQKLARVRNPWNSERYNGPWSDKSDKWTAKFKQEAGYVDSNDGAFFLPFDLYVTEFWGASVALYQPYKGFHQENYMQSVRSQTFTVNNPAEQEFYVMAETYSDRNFPRTCNPENNSVLYMYGPDNKMVGTYGFIGWRGFGFAGLAG